jgi:hypothetical protein
MVAKMKSVWIAGKLPPTPGSRPMTRKLASRLDPA